MAKFLMRHRLINATCSNCGDEAVLESDSRADRTLTGVRLRCLLAIVFLGVSTYKPCNH